MTGLSTGPTMSPSTGLSTGPTMSPSTGLSTGPTMSPSTGLSTGPTMSPSTGLSTGPTIDFNGEKICCFNSPSVCYVHSVCHNCILINHAFSRVCPIVLQLLLNLPINPNVCFLITASKL